MKLRKLKRRHDARTGYRASFTAPKWAPGIFCHEDEYFDYDEDDDWACTHCGGEGFDQVDDPLWDDCDEYGYGECSACSGTGQRRHQTVF